MHRDVHLCPATDREHEAVIEQRATCPRDSILVCRGCGAWRQMLAPAWHGWRFDAPPAGDYWLLT
jgi:hypothetical protein